MRSFLNYSLTAEMTDEQKNQSVIFFARF